MGMLLENVMEILGTRRERLAKALGVMDVFGLPHV